MSKRAERRHKLHVLKEKCKDIIRGWGGEPNKRFVGKMASVHGAPCSCSRCGNPRHIHNEKTRQEIEQDEKDRLDGGDLLGERD